MVSFQHDIITNGAGVWKKKQQESLPPCQQAMETQYELGIKLRKQVWELGFSIPSSTEKIGYIVQVSSRFT